MKNTNSGGRWNDWMGRARVCFRAAGAIDAGANAVHAVAREVSKSFAADDVLSALREAEAALLTAREAVQAALKAKQLTASNREVAYAI